MRRWIVTGDLIYSRLREGFREVQFGAPAPAPRAAGLQQRLDGVRTLLDIFVDKGWCLSASISDVQPGAGGRGGSFTIRTEGPANLWGLQMEAAQRSSAFGCHDAAAVGALLRAGGARAAGCRLSWGDTAVTQRWSVEV